MSINYVTVQWSKHKKVYDLVSISFIVLYILSYVFGSLYFFPKNQQFSMIVLFIRAFGSCAIILLHVILLMGPLARLNSIFLPLVYNRRHLGVMTAVLAVFHGVLVTFFYHGFGTVSAFVSLLTSSSEYTSFTAFPFEIFGLLALLILLLLSSTSHDFWQKNLGRDNWKTLHMSIYVAYAAVIIHTALGVMQSEQASLYVWLVSLGFIAVVNLHLFTFFKERKKDKGSPLVGDDWLFVANQDSFEINKAKMICTAGGERIAVFKHEKGFSAVTNLCAHQGGPLSEGQIIDGCITCPWHGWQYRPEDGQSPPPFREKVGTYKTKIIDSKIFVWPTPEGDGVFIKASTGESL